MKPDYLNMSISGAKGKDRGLFRILAKLCGWLGEQKLRIGDAITKQAEGRKLFFLFLSQRRSSEEAARLALRLGMDPHGTDEAGIPLALQPLIMNPREDTDWGATQVFLEAGACVDLEDPSGGTALALAAYHGQHKLPLLEWLLARGANPLHEDKNGRTPLFRALDGRKPFLSFGDASEHTEVLDRLLEATGPLGLETQDRHGRTPLMLAQDRRDIGAVECIQAWERRWESGRRRGVLAAMTSVPEETFMSARRM